MANIQTETLLYTQEAGLKEICRKSLMKTLLRCIMGIVGLAVLGANCQITSTSAANFKIMKKQCTNIQLWIRLSGKLSANYTGLPECNAVKQVR